MDLQEVGGDCEDWMELAQDRDRWRARVSTVMFRVVCEPSSGSSELCLAEITLGGSQIFFVSLVAVWQRNFEPAVCVQGTTGCPSPSYRGCEHTYARARTRTRARLTITLPNTDQAHEKYL